MKKITYKSYHANISFIDLLFNMVLGFVFLFVVSFLLITIQMQKANISTKAEFLITLTWDTNNPDDVDIWVEDPEENVIFFRQKEKGLMHLDRDDLGNINDTITTADGKVISYPYNQELVTIRGFIKGEWTVNIHMYNKRSPEPANIEVKIEKLNPTVKIILYEKFKISKNWDEVTVARLMMLANGEILSVDRTPKSLIKSKLLESGMDYRTRPGNGLYGGPM